MSSQTLGSGALICKESFLEFETKTEQKTSTTQQTLKQVNEVFFAKNRRIIPTLELLHAFASSTLSGKT